MDAIVLKVPGEILYRPHGEHEHSPGVDSVVSVLPMCTQTPPRVMRKAEVKNIAGTFVNALEPGRHSTVAFKAWKHFGDHMDMYHISGSVTLYKHCAQFKGCRGIKSIRALARDLCLESTACAVHMGVFGASIGRKVHTGLGCFLENRLANRFHSLRVCGRIIDMSSVIKLRIDAFDPSEMPHLDGECIPKSVDILISGQGSINVRISWTKCMWDEEVERKVLSFCSWIASVFRECC